MTQVSPPDPALDAPVLIEAGAQSLVNNAARLGLTWDLLLATVTEGTDPGNIQATTDADDTTALTMISMVGPLPEGERVYVLKVPPSGMFIVGRNTQVSATPIAAVILDLDTTSSNVFGDLLNVGPIVDVAIGPSGKALVTLGAALLCDAAAFSAIMSYSLSGANTKTAAQTGNMLFLSNNVVGSGLTDLGNVSLTFLETGLTPGMTKFTVKYRSRFGGGTSGFDNRTIAVQPL